MFYSSTYDSPLGRIYLLANREHLISLRFEEWSRDFADVQVAVSQENGIIKQAKDWLDGYFGGRKGCELKFSLLLNGTDFQKIVWRLLLEIPFGETATYGDLAGCVAQEMGVSKMSAQAVGFAVGRNPIALIVSCHRVVGANKKLVGYAGGVERKVWLLRHEGIL